MITIDSRIGSKQLLSYFPRGSAELGQLDFADFSFIGNGPDNEPWQVGIERKTVKDLLNSMTTGRFSGHQLLGLLNSYDTIYLIVEGLWRTSPSNGILQERKGSNWGNVALGQRQFMGKELDGFVNTLSVMGGILVRETVSQRDTARLVLSLYHWWNRDWEDHKSHMALHKNRFRDDSAIFPTKPSLLRRVAAELVGIGWKRSKDVERHFNSVWEMANAEEEEWREVKGVGKGIAEKVYREIRRI